MSHRLEITPTATAQLHRLHAWWKEHRPAAAMQVLDEFDRICRLIAERPHIGTPVPKRPGVRRLQLHKTPYYAFYRVKPGQNIIQVVALWSAMRKKGPPIPRP